MLDSPQVQKYASNINSKALFKDYLPTWCTEKGIIILVHNIISEIHVCFVHYIYRNKWVVCCMRTYTVRYANGINDIHRINIRMNSFLFYIKGDTHLQQYNGQMAEVGENVAFERHINKVKTNVSVSQ